MWRCDRLVDNGKELYVIAGGYGMQGELTASNGFKINVPSHLWKVIVVLDPGQGIADINPETRIITVDIPNTNEIEGKQWQDYLVSIETLENNLRIADLNYDFLSNTLPELQKSLNRRKIPVL